MMLGQKLRSLRQAKGVSQADVARDLGVTQQAVGSWERDKSEPTPSMFKRLSRYFGVSTDYLLDNEPTEQTFLTTERAKLINDFEELTPEGQRLIWETLRVLLSASRQAAVV